MRSSPGGLKQARTVPAAPLLLRPSNPTTKPLLGTGALLRDSYKKKKRRSNQYKVKPSRLITRAFLLQAQRFTAAGAREFGRRSTAEEAAAAMDNASSVRHAARFAGGGGFFSSMPCTR